MENHIDFVEAELHIQHTPTKTKYSLTPYCRNTLKRLYNYRLFYTKNNK